jgi:UDP-GlcNAc3NAcA epimerase
MLKIVTVLGARPQFIKAAPVSRALNQAGFQEVLVHTGQHYDANLSDIFFEQLGLCAPDHHLGIGSASHGAQTGRMLAAVEEVLVQERPDILMVYGDTNSTLAGALAAAKLHIPVAHVEAGLRSFNRAMPEEVNRVLTDHLSRWLFVPTPAARDHLLREGLDPAHLYEVGDVMMDAQRHFRGVAAGLELDLDVPDNFILATIHRQENTDDLGRLTAIVEALERVACEVPVCLPLHPRTARALELARLSWQRVQVLPPLGYLEMLALEQRAQLIVTDSGGVQKEAYLCSVPCLTLREDTEWNELLETGWNQLCPPNSADAIVAAVFERRGRKGQDVELYGDGKAAQKIARILLGGVVSSN